MSTVVSWILCSVLAEVSYHPILVRWETRKAATWIKASQTRGHECCRLMDKPLWCRVLVASSSSSETVGRGSNTQGYRPYCARTLKSARSTVVHSCDEDVVLVMLNLHACLISTAWMHFQSCTELTGEDFHYQKCWCCLATSTFTERAHVPRPVRLFVRVTVVFSRLHSWVCHLVLFIQTRLTSCWTPEWMFFFFFYWLHWLSNRTCEALNKNCSEIKWDCTSIYEVIMVEICGI